MTAARDHRLGIDSEERKQNRSDILVPQIAAGDAEALVEQRAIHALEGAVGLRMAPTVRAISS
jgi:hypothetical protein